MSCGIAAICPRSTWMYSHVNDKLAWDVVQQKLLRHQVVFLTRQHHGSWHQFPLEWHQSSALLHCGASQKSSNHRTVQPISEETVKSLRMRFRARWTILKAWSCWKLIPCSTSRSIDANEAPRKRHWPNGLCYKWKQVQHGNGMSKTCSWGASLHIFLRPWICDTSTDICGCHWWRIGMLGADCWFSACHVAWITQGEVKIEVAWQP